MKKQAHAHTSTEHSCQSENWFIHEIPLMMKMNYVKRKIKSRVCSDGTQNNRNKIAESIFDWRTAMFFFLALPLFHSHSRSVHTLIVVQKKNFAIFAVTIRIFQAHYMDMPSLDIFVMLLALFHCFEHFSNFIMSIHCRLSEHTCTSARFFQHTQTKLSLCDAFVPSNLV